MGLLPIEFTHCLTDSPYFRANLLAHERELDLTSSQIKGLIREVKELLQAATVLSRAQRNVAKCLSNFQFECIGGSQTDDEIVIARSFQEFGRYLSLIEDERDRMLERAQDTFIKPIEKFRVDHISAVRQEGKKKFDKETLKFCQSLDKHLNLSTKKSETHLQEADAALLMEQRHFTQASFEYVAKLQEVQERKKFEFVETILSFMYGWLTFYHQGHEVARDFKNFMTQLQIRLQRTRENYEATQNETQALMNKMLEIRKSDPGSLNKMYAREGYLFMMEKKAFGTTWTKTFCQYQKDSRRFTMIPYNQTVGKFGTTESITLKECIRRMSDSIDKRFCFNVTPVDKPQVYTFQALSEEDRKLWLDAMDGKDPIQISNGQSGKSGSGGKPEEYCLDDLGFAFVRKCIELIESRGLEDQGLYRVGGVNSKVTKLISTTLDRRKLNSDGEIVIDVDLSEEWEIRTVTSALKTYLRNLPEPVMTFRLHTAFIAAAKQESKEKRIDHVHELVHRLPKLNFEMCHILMRHLSNVANHSDVNLMNVCNLGVCFGPTLLRPEEETVAAIMDIKFGNVVVEILIENCDKIFNTKPNSDNYMRSGSFGFGHHSSPPIASIPPNVNYSYPTGASGGCDLQSLVDMSGTMRSIGSGVYSRPMTSSYAISGDSPINSSPQTYATVPTRSGLGGLNSYMNTNDVNSNDGGLQVCRSSSYDQLAQQQSQVSRPPMQQRTVFYSQQHPPPKPHLHMMLPPNYQTNPQAVGGSMYQTVHRSPGNTMTPVPSSSASSAVVTPMSRNSRPLAVFNPWNTQPANIDNPQMKNKISSNPETPTVQQTLAPNMSNSPRSSPSSNTLISSSFNPYTGVGGGVTSSATESKPPSSMYVTQSTAGGSSPMNNMTGSSVVTSPAPTSSSVNTGRCVRTLYACVGENETELTFEPNMVIYDVRQSHEPGWLEGRYNGRTGLIPGNYVKYID